MTETNLLKQPKYLGEAGKGGSSMEHPMDVENDNVVSLVNQRTSVDLSPQSQDELKWLCRYFGSDDRAGVIGMALHVFWLLATMNARGISITIRDTDGSNSLFIPSLAAINGLLRASARDKRLRLTFEMPARALKELEELRILSQEKKKADVVRQAIHLTWTLLNEVDLGRVVVVNDPEKGTYDLFVPKAQCHKNEEQAKQS